MRIATICTVLVTAIGASAISGCVADKAYRSRLSPLLVPAEPRTLPTAPPALRVGNPCSESKPTEIIALTPARDVNGNRIPNASGPCIAFIEYDDHGHAQVPNQLDRATSLIRKAIEDDPQHQPVILAFVHGWKHNASPGPPEDNNIQGFEHVLNYLYSCFYGGQDSSGKDCHNEPTSAAPTPGHVVVGIFIAWRGEIISHDWPVARTLLIYSRARAANKVGGVDLRNAIDQISIAARPQGAASLHSQPLLVLVGHSFGGRVLEPVVNALYMKNLRARDEEIERHFDLLNQDKADTNRHPIPAFADLVVYINSATPALSAVPMLRFFAQQKLEYREEDPNNSGTGRNRPLILSITTPADAATGLLFPIAFGADGFQKKLNGALRGQERVDCYDPSSHSVPPPVSRSQFDFYIHSAAHFDWVQSHELVDLGPPPNPGDSNSCPSAPSPETYDYGILSRCFRIEPKKALPNGAPRCNGTPYWIINTQGDIIPDHSTIFTDRLIRFIGEFLPTSGATLISTPRLSSGRERELTASSQQK